MEVYLFPLSIRRIRNEVFAFNYFGFWEKGNDDGSISDRAVRQWRKYKVCGDSDGEFNIHVTTALMPHRLWHPVTWKQQNPINSGAHSIEIEKFVSTGNYSIDKLKTNFVTIYGGEAKGLYFVLSSMET